MSGVADAYHCTATRNSKLICVRQALRAKLVCEPPAHLQGGREGWLWRRVLWGCAPHPRRGVSKARSRFNVPATLPPCTSAIPALSLVVSISLLPFPGQRGYLRSPSIFP